MTPRLPTPKIPDPTGPIRFRALNEVNTSGTSLPSLEVIRNANPDESNDKSSLASQFGEKSSQNLVVPHDMSKDIPSGPHQIEVSGFTVQDGFGIGSDLKLIPVLITGKFVLLIAFYDFYQLYFTFIL